jgi:predicted outer membrane repeat protein
MQNHTIEVSLVKKIWIALAPALGVMTLGGAANAATINVTTTGAPVGGKCSLTQAIEAAVTNTAVGGAGGCPAGSAFSTDTIVLEANKTYADYGIPLHVPTTGGSLVIRGTLSGGSISTKISGRNYGYPSPNPLNSGVCPYPAALFTGGSNLTLRNLGFEAKPAGTGHTGICQYSGALTLDNVVVGDGGLVNYFNRGGIRSFPNSGNTRTLTLTGARVHGNSTPGEGGGLNLFGNVSVTINGDSWFDQNYADGSGGAIFWDGTGTVNITDTDFFYNESGFGSGGAIYMNPLSNTSSATLTRVEMQQNTAGYYGGAAYAGVFFGTNKLALNDVYFLDNHATSAPGVPWDGMQQTFNTDSTYNAIYCTNGSHFSGLHGVPWTLNSPRLKGDGTCTYETW